MASVAFGTDGIRGAAFTELTVEVAYALGRAAAEVLGAESFLIGRDTRVSGPAIAAALAAGIEDAGGRPVDVGVLPTPGVAHLCSVRGLPGAVVSASHNPSADNGIKILSAGGVKLTDEQQAAVAEVLNAILADGVELPLLVERSLDDHDAASATSYVDHRVGVLGEGALDGLRIVVDCANGAASPVAALVLRRLGAEIEVLAADPSGTNINAGVGSTHPEALAAAVVAAGADLGLALDGDADRLVAVDETGCIVPGDTLLVLFARALEEAGTLGGAIVVTVMSNLGLHVALREAGITVVEVGVGDRNVLHALDERGLVLGGEQSGHVIFRDRATTGDGLLTGILLADLVRRSDQPLSQLAGDALVLYPQVLVNVAVDRTDALDDPIIVAAEAALVERLGATGRVLLRASGTEPLVRVMVEAADAEVAQREADALAEVVVDRLGTPSV